MPDILVLNNQEVRELAPVEELIGWMRSAMMATTKRDAVLPLRGGLVLPEDYGKLGMMPGYLGDTAQAAGVKLVALVPPHRRKGSSHSGLLVLYDADGLEPIAILCGATVTALRTAAMTAAATDALAGEEASVLTILGTGEQAYAHARSMLHVRDFSEFRIWGRNADHANSFSKAIQDELGVQFKVIHTVADAVAGADVICTVTASSEPVLFGHMVTEGTHVNLVGSSHRGAVEADTELVGKTEFFVDYIPSVMDQAGEFLAALKEGTVQESHIQGEIGHVFMGDHPGRAGKNSITLYKSLGVAAQDIITAKNVYEKAVAAGLGVKVSV